MIFKIILSLIIILIVILMFILYFLYIPSLEIDTKTDKKEKLLRLEKWLHQIYQSKKFNGSVFLAKRGNIIFSKSYGYNSSNSLEALTQHSSFNLASVSKQFTAMGIVILYKNAKLKYSDKLSQYIPELTHYNDITIEQLLHHTSGLPDYMKLAMQYSDQKDIFTTSKMVSIYKEKKPKLNFKPGSKFEYSNSGYVLLSEIIERVSGVTFAKFMLQNIFEPLQMKNTQIFNLLSKEEPKNRVYGYKNKFWLFGGNKLKNDLNVFDGVVGDGAVYSTAYDLYLWDLALKKSTLVPSNIYAPAYVPAVLNNGDKTKYGFGWFLNKDNSVEHAGGWQGFTSFIYRNLETEELIIILDNSSNILRVNSIGFRFNSIGINLKDFMKKYE